MNLHTSLIIFYSVKSAFEMLKGVKNLLLKKIEQKSLAPPFPKVDLAQPFSKVEKFIPEV
jgi:hypothetical protein